jgi:hypothetical protein
MPQSVSYPYAYKLGLSRPRSDKIQNLLMFSPSDDHWVDEDYDPLSSEFFILPPLVSVRLSIYLSIYPSIYLWLYCPFVGPWPLFQFLNLYIVGRTPCTGDQPVARPLPTYRTTQTQNKSTQTAMPGVGFEPTIPVFERAKTVHVLDRAATVTGHLGVCFLQNWCRNVNNSVPPRLNVNANKTPFKYSAV